MSAEPLTEEGPDDFSAAAEVMLGVFEFVFAHGEGKRPRWKTAFRKFASVAWLLQPGLLDHASLRRIAPELGVTRAAMSKLIQSFGDRHGLRNVLQKPEATRRVYAEVQLRDHWRSRAKRKPAAPCETAGPL
jgi:hypothetical protein